MSNRVKLHRLGQRLTDNDIEPSCSVMDVLGRNGEITHRVVIDCGLLPKQGTGKDGLAWHAPDLSLFEDGRPIDAVVITHVHTDHVGYLPALSKYLAKNAQVTMTKPSWGIVKHGLREGLSVNEKRGSKLPFSLAEMDDILNRERIIYRPGEYEILSGLSMYAHPAGHINGSCSYTFRVRRHDFIHYSGDNCKHNQAGIKGAQLLPKNWYPTTIAVSDCTYGADMDSDFRSWDEEAKKAATLAADALARKQIILFFAFGIHRGGAVAHELGRQGIRSRVFLDGSIRYYAHQQNGPMGRWCDLDEAFQLQHTMRVVGKPAIGAPMIDTPVVGMNRDRLIEEGNLAVITTGGMGGPGGPGVDWRRHVLPNPEATIAFTGYVAPDSDGAKILAAAQERKRTGQRVSVAFSGVNEKGEPMSETLPVECRVEQVRLSSHDSRRNILEWFREYRPETAILTHGSKQAFDSLSAELSTEIPHLVRSDETPSI